MNLILILSNIVLSATITLNLTYKDKVTRVNIGDIVKIGLNSADDAEKTSWEWMVPAASNPEVLEIQDADKSSDPGIDAVFKVVGKGSTTVTLFKRCRASVPRLVCPTIVIPWRITITTE